MGLALGWRGQKGINAGVKSHQLDAFACSQGDKPGIGNLAMTNDTAGTCRQHLVVTKVKRDETVVLVGNVLPEYLSG